MAFKKTITIGLDYKDFTGGIDACNAEMKKLDGEFKLASSQMEYYGTASEKAGLKAEYLGQKINLQKEKVQKAEERYNALMSSQADTKSIERADAALLKERTTLQNLENDMRKARLESTNFKKSVQALTAVTTTIVTGLAACVKSSAEFADSMITLSAQTGVSTDTLQEWAYAAGLIDVSLETMTGSLKKLTKGMESAVKGTGTTADAFKQLGVKVTDSHGQMRKAEDVFYDVIDALGKVRNETTQDQLAMDIFGRSAADLTGVIAIGSKGLKEYGFEAEELGRIIDGSTLQKEAQLSDAMDKLTSAFNSVKNSLAADIIPAITALLNAIAAIPTPVLNLLVILASVIAMVMSLAKVFASAKKAGETLKGAFSVLGKSTDSFYVKLVAIVAIITVLVALLVVLTGKAKDVGVAFNGINTNAITGNGGGNRGGYPHNASGSTNWRGGTTWVGENGAELVSLPAGSRIYNSEESKAAAGNTYNVSINCDLSRIRRINDVVDMVEGVSMSAGGR